MSNAGTLETPPSIQDAPGIPRANDLMDEGAIIIPGRPYAQRDSANGREYAHAVRAAARHLARDGQPVIPDAFLELRLTLFFTPPPDAPEGMREMPRHWGDHGIPHAHRGGEIILTALTGILYASPAQIQPLTVTRFIRAADDLERERGSACRRGLAEIRWIHA